MTDNIHQVKISAISNSDWNMLFGLIPEIENTKDFGTWSKSEQLANGSFAFPHYVPSSIVSDFERKVYGIGLILNFDWMEWETGQELIRAKNTDFDLLDIITLCKLITMIIRADRFNEGYLESCFKDGLVLRILKSLEKKLVDG